MGTGKDTFRIMWQENENEYVVSLQRNINNMYKPETMGTERISIKEEISVFLVYDK